MNQKQCKKLRRDIKQMFSFLPVRQTEYQSLGRRARNVVVLDEKGQRKVELRQVEVGRMVNVPKTQRGLYRQMKKQYQQG